MKKIIVSILVFAFVNAKAQDKFSLGIKVGQNLSTVSNVYVDHNAASYHVGVVAQFGITKLISIVPEIILSQTKLEAAPDPLGLSVNTITKPETYHLNYLAIPILVQVKPVKGLLFQAGPQYSILIDQKKDGIENATFAFKSGEFAMVAGAKVDLGGFFLYGRYVVGMENISTGQQLNNQITDQSSWKTKQWQLGIGMTLFNF